MPPIIVPYERSFARSDKAEFWSDKNKVKPEDVYLCSNKEYWFNCSNCDHDFDICLNRIKKGDWCLYCRGQKFCGDPKCKLCFSKSFASSEKAKFWSDKNEKSPFEVALNCRKKFLFKCGDCKHTFDDTLAHVNNGHWCGFCANRRLCGKKSCDTCFQKSFALHEKAEFWSSENDLKPIQVFYCSHKKFKFDCNKCDHQFSASIHGITNGNWCPFCVSRRLCEDDSCTQCYEKSFASHKKMKYWSLKNEITPRDVFLHSDTSHFFNCNKCNREFTSRPGDISRGRWCPFCKNKTEQKLYNFLANKYPSAIHCFKADWCLNKKTGQYLPFDMYLPKSRIIIELDGRQHFAQVSNWQDPQFTQERDIYKMKCANKNEYSVIRILQEDVYSNKYNWQSELCKNIEKIRKMKSVTNIFMCKKNEYAGYKICM